MFIIFLTLAIFIPERNRPRCGIIISSGCMGLTRKSPVVGTVPNHTSRLLTAIMHIRFNAVVTVFSCSFSARYRYCLRPRNFSREVGTELEFLEYLYVSHQAEKRFRRASLIIAAGYWGRPILIQRLSLGALSLRGDAHFGGKHNKLANAIFISFLITVVFELLLLIPRFGRAAKLALRPWPIPWNPLGGHTLNVIVSLGIALAIFNAVLACIITLARVIYSSGRARRGRALLMIGWQPSRRGSTPMGRHASVIRADRCRAARSLERGSSGDVHRGDACGRVRDDCVCGHLLVYFCKALYASFSKIRE